MSLYWSVLSGKYDHYSHTRTHDIAAAAATAMGFAWAGGLYKLGSLWNQLTTDRALEHQVTSRERRTPISGPLGGPNICGAIQEITERFHELVT